MSQISIFGSGGGGGGGSPQRPGGAPQLPSPGGGFNPFRGSGNNTTIINTKPKTGGGSKDRKFPGAVEGDQTGKGIAGGLDSIKGILEDELNEQQKLADEQHEHLRGIEDEFRDEIQDGIDSSRDTAEEIADRLREAGEENLNEIRDRIEATEAEFENNTAQLVQSQTFGMQRGMSTEIDSIEAQIRSGQLPEAVGRQRIRELENSRMETLSMSLTNIGSQYNQQAAALSSTGTQQLQGAMNAQMSYEQGAASALMAGEQMAQKWAGMYPALGQMAGSNPPPFVSMFAGITAMLELAMGAYGSVQGATALNGLFGLNMDGSPIGGEDGLPDGATSDGSDHGYWLNGIRYAGSSK